MADRKKYLAAYYQKNKKRADKITNKYNRTHKKEKQIANKKYRDKINPDLKKRI